MASAVDLVVRVIADTSKAVRGLKDVEGAAGKMRGGLKAAAIPAAAALTAVTGAAIAAGFAAAEDAQSQAILANTLKNTTDATTDQVASVEDYIGAMSRASGVADDELRPAMSNLLRATGDVSTSQKALAQTLDIAAATGKSVDQVSQAIAKAYGGQTTSLKKLVPSLDEATLASGDMTAIMAELAAQTGGASAAAADTAAGKMQKMTVSMDEAKESIGASLLPLMAKLASALETVGIFAQEHPAIFQAIAVSIAAMAASILVANVAMGVLTLATTLFGAAAVTAWLAAAAPIALVIVGVLAVVAVIVILWKRCDTFRNVVTALWNAIKTGATAVGGAISRAFSTAFAAASGAVRAFLSVASTVWGAIRGAVSAVGAFIAAAFRTAQGAVSAVWHAISGFVSSAADKIMGILRALPGKIKGAFSGAATLLTDVGRAIIEGLGAGVDAATDWLMGKFNALMDKIPGWARKRMGIASPSKVMAKIGKQITEGIAVGMDEGLSAVTAISEKVMATISSTIDKAFKSQKKVAARTKEVAKAIKGETKDLRDNAVARDANTAALEIANKTLEDAQKQYDSLSEKVRDAALAYAAVTDLPDEATDAGAMVTAMGARVAAVEKFADDLDALRAAGLAESIIQDLAQKGVEGAGAQAAAILAGGAGSIAAFNALQVRLEAAAAALGTSTADAMYAAGVASAQGLVDGLVLDQNTLEEKATAFAEALAKAVRKALRKALKGGGGGGGGGDSSTFLAPVIPITSAASAGKAPGVPSSRANVSSGYAVNVTVNGAIDPEATARQIRRVLRGHDRRVGLVSE